MAPEKHALLGASSAYRWINCPPSARLCEGAPDTESPYAEEGTRAHALCEYLVNAECGKRNAEKPDFEYDEEMLEAAIGYRDYVLEMIGPEPDAVCVEQRVDYSRYLSRMERTSSESDSGQELRPVGFGTVDCLAVSGDTLFIFDFKYGQGVEVDADRNPQLMCYALGGYEMFSPIFGLRSVVLNIYQPRREHVSVYSMSLAELLEWAEKVLRPAAVLADAGEGEMNPGEWCRFCRVKATCRKLSEQNLELAKLDFPAPETLSPAEIGKILPKLDSLVDWAKALQDHALALAVGGQTVPGYKLVAGRSVRKFRSEADACLKIKAAGFNPYITKMKGITELQKDMGKKQFEEVCGGELIKPAGKPALVPLSDKRPELMTSAEADFAEE